MKLNKIKNGEQVCIQKMDFEFKDYRRLLHLGLYEGAHIIVEHQKKHGALLIVRGNIFMLRSEDLCKIEVDIV